MDKQEVFLIILFIITLISVLHASWSQEALTQRFNQLESFHLVFHPLLRVSLLDLFGSIMSCKFYRESNLHTKSWLEVLIGCTLLQFGGTTLTGIILGQTPSWIMSVAAFPALLIAWWLTFFCPFDLYWRISHNIPAFYFFIGLGASISSGHAVTSWGVDKAYFNAFHNNSKAYHTAFLVNILCGTLSASGGRLLYDWLGMERKFPESFTITRSPLMLKPGGYIGSPVVNRAFILAVGYYVLVRYEHLNRGLESTANFTPPHLFRWIVGSLQMTNYIVLYFWPSVDIFAILSSLVLKVLLVAPTIHPPSQIYP